MTDSLADNAQRIVEQDEPSQDIPKEDDPTYTLAIAIEFLGTHYYGWQRQKEVLGVQQVLETAISKVANETVEVIAAGRTDSGVHASNMLAHFVTRAYRPTRN